MQYFLLDNEEQFEETRQAYILDTPASKALEDITRLASIICNAPIAFIRLIDTNHQCLKYQHGIDDEDIHHVLAFCSHTIIEPNKVFIVPDLTAQQNLPHQPLVINSRDIRFYVSIPLTTPGKKALGSLCIFDYVPRDLTLQQLDTLHILARQISYEIELQRNLAASKVRLQMVTKNAPLILYTLDRNGIVIYSNGNNLEDLGVQPGQFIGCSIFELYSEQPDIQNKIRQVLAGTPQVWTKEYKNHVYENRLTPLIGENETIFGAIGIIFDSGSKFKAVIDNVPGAIYHRVYDDNWTMNCLSDAIENISGYPSSDFLGNRVRTYASIINPEDKKQIDQQIKKAIELREPYMIQYRIIHSSGNIRWVYERGRAFYTDSEQKIWLDGAIFDITEHKVAEEEAHKKLCEEKEILNQKARFMSMTSHEFRNPLTIISSSNELLKNYYHKFSAEDRQKYFKNIETATKHLLELFDDILTISKANAQKIEFNPAPLKLKEFCREIVNEIQLSHGSNNQIVFTSSGNCTNRVVDEKLLWHILTNLLSNALKYSPKPEIIELKLSCLERKTILQVKDSGIGIPKNDLPLLFDPYHRASNVGQIKGTGLGLSIVKSMVDLHGGTIDVESEVGVGTIFTITLPSLD